MYCDNALSLNITDSDLKNNQASSSGAVLIGMNIRIIGILRSLIDDNRGFVRGGAMSFVQF